MILFIARKIFNSAKRNLFKDQAAWSGRDIKIKYNNKKEFSESDENSNFLKIIADESETYLEDESKKKEDENK